MEVQDMGHVKMASKFSRFDLSIRQTAGLH